MSAWLAAAAAGAAWSLLQYGWRWPLRGRVAIPATLRALTIAIIVALLLNAPLGPARRPAPWIGLDASLSMTRDSLSPRGASPNSPGPSSGLTPQSLARDSAASIHADSTFLFGDSVRPARTAGPGSDSSTDVATKLRPLADRAVASGHPLILITDGELDDPDALVSLPSGSRAIVLPRLRGPDVAITSVDAPRAVVVGDTATITVSLSAGSDSTPAGTVALDIDGKPLGAAPFDVMAPWGSTNIVLHAPILGPATPAVLRAVTRVAGDLEPRNDTAMVAIDRSASAKAVVVSSRPDPDVRYAIAVLRGALSIPTRAYFEVAPNAWRIDATLAPVSEADVRAALHDASIAVIHGDSTIFGPPHAATAAPLALLVPARDTSGEWYATAASLDSPLSPALADSPWDSLAPLSVGGPPPHGTWLGVVAQNARTGPAVPIVVGSESPRRTVVVAASGMWRWRERGGVSADTYSAFWGSIFDWLAAEQVDRRAALPAAAAYRAGQPIAWRRGNASDSVVRIVLTKRNAPPNTDSITLRFPHGTMIATSAPMASGIYDVAALGGPSILVVQPPAELIPRKPAVKSGRVGQSGDTTGSPAGARDFAFFYVLIVLFLCAEWIARRRLGMR